MATFESYIEQLKHNCPFEKQGMVRDAISFLEANLTLKLTAAHVELRDREGLGRRREYIEEKRKGEARDLKELLNKKYTNMTETQKAEKITQIENKLEKFDLLLNEISPAKIEQTVEASMPKYIVQNLGLYNEIVANTANHMLEKRGEEKIAQTIDGKELFVKGADGKMDIDVAAFEKFSRAVDFVSKSKEHGKWLTDLQKRKAEVLEKQTALREKFKTENEKHAAATEAKERYTGEIETATANYKKLNGELYELTRNNYDFSPEKLGDLKKYKELEQKMNAEKAKFALFKDKKAIAGMEKEMQDLEKTYGRDLFHQDPKKVAEKLWADTAKAISVYNKDFKQDEIDVDKIFADPNEFEKFKIEIGNRKGEIKLQKDEWERKTAFAKEDVKTAEKRRAESDREKTASYIRADDAVNGKEQKENMGALTELLEEEKLADATTAELNDMAWSFDKKDLEKLEQYIEGGEKSAEFMVLRALVDVKSRQIGFDKEKRQGENQYRYEENLERHLKEYVEKEGLTDIAKQVEREVAKNVNQTARDNKEIAGMENWN